MAAYAILSGNRLNHLLSADQTLQMTGPADGAPTRLSDSLEALI